MKTVSILGAGRLGASLGYALKCAGYAISSLTCRTLSSARESWRIVGEGRVSTDNAGAAAHSRLVFITVPDDLIASVAAEMAAEGRSWSSQHVFHCSGLLDAAVLNPLKQQGAGIASFHPAQSFACKSRNVRAFRGIYYGIEGQGSSLSIARTVAADLGGRSWVLKADDKPRYHAACSMASNFLTVLLDSASALLESAGLNPEESRQLMLALVEGTLQNVKKFDTSSALTGPLTRGDRASVTQHLAALEPFPELLALYRRMAEHALRMARKSNKIPLEKSKDLESLLADK